jgi:hypothetical protein
MRQSPHFRTKTRIQETKESRQKGPHFTRSPEIDKRIATRERREQLLVTMLVAASDSMNFHPVTR